MNPALITSIDDMNRFVELFIQKTPRGAVVLLKGDMGIGKTTFVRLLANQLYPGLRVTSPTFAVRSQYLEGRVIEHFDFYRFENMTDTDLWNLGYFEAIEHANETFGYVFVEWPEKVTTPGLLKADVEIQFRWTQSDARSVALQFLRP